MGFDEGSKIRSREREELRWQADGMRNAGRELEGQHIDPAFSAGVNICTAIAMLTKAVCNVGEELAALRAGGIPILGE
jgi:hypothetical protein